MVDTVLGHHNKKSDQVLRTHYEVFLRNQVSQVPHQQSSSAKYEHHYEERYNVAVCTGHLRSFAFDALQVAFDLVKL